jgi:hypothetical protein
VTGWLGKASWSLAWAGSMSRKRTTRRLDLTGALPQYDEYRGTIAVEVNIFLCRRNSIYAIVAAQTACTAPSPSGDDDETELASKIEPCQGYVSRDNPRSPVHILNSSYKAVWEQVNVINLACIKGD